MTVLRYSIVIPAYNSAELVGNAIESALAQTVKPLEVIVVDDGSSDNTAEIAESFGPPVRVYRQANAGPGSARNYGVSVASGDWIALLDADDEWLPTKAEVQADLINDDRIALVFCKRPVELESVPDHVPFERLWRSNCIVTSSVLIRRDVFNALGGFSPERSLIGTEDYNLWLRLAHAGYDIVTCHSSLVRYTPQESSLSRQVARFAAAEIANIDSLAKSLPLAANVLFDKKMKIYESYGRELIFIRHGQEARLLLAEPLKFGWTPMRLFWWAMTFVPAPILNLRRKLAGRPLEGSSPT